MKLRYLKAFTLVEIIIVILIISILLGISISSYRRLNDIKGLETQTETIIELIENIKNKALYIDKSDLLLTPTEVVNSGGDTISTQKVREYNITFLSLPSPKISLNINYCNDFTCTSTQNDVIRSYSLPINYEFIPASAQITFIPKQTYITTPFSIFLKHTELNTCKEIILSSSLVITSQNTTCP